MANTITAAEALRSYEEMLVDVLRAGVPEADVDRLRRTLNPVLEQLRALPPGAEAPQAAAEGVGLLRESIERLKQVRVLVKVAAARPVSGPPCLH
jgi:hypothetical protein